MYELDKKKFGQFVAELRKEKSFTQRELAERLHLSDKAVSKWETGASIPDTAMLIPLSELLGVSVTELLMCRRLENDVAIESEEVEALVKRAISCADERPKRAWQEKSRWILIYAASLAACGLGILLNRAAGKPYTGSLMTITGLSAVFGAYFCCFVKLSLPAFYDENELSFFCDGAFRMNVPGLKFNNRNWPKIIKLFRIVLCLSLIGFPIVNYLLGSILPQEKAVFGQFLLLALFLCAMFVPLYAVGRKNC